MSTDLNAMLGRAEDIVKRASTAGADEAEAFLIRNVELELEIENGAISTTARRRTEGGSVRVLQDGRVGFAFFTSDAGIDRAIQRALDLSRLMPRKGFQFADPSTGVQVHDRWNDDIAALEVDASLQAGKDLIAAAKDAAPESHVAGGGVGTQYHVEALANTRGIAVADRSTHASIGINLIVPDGERSLNAWDSAANNHAIPDPVALAADVAKDVLSMRNPTAPVGGNCDIVFRPEAVSELLNGLVVGAVIGDEAMRGKTVWSNKRGELVADAGLSILDDPSDPKGLGMAPFDGDGVAAKPLPIIQDGVLENYLFDQRDAIVHDEKTTGSAVRGGFKSAPSVGVHHLSVRGKKEQNEADIIAGVDAGYLVESVLGAHTANATTGDFSVTAPNVWRIEKGDIVGPVTEIAIGGNLPELLKGLDGIGDTRKRMDGASVPLMRFRDIHVSA